MRFVLFCHSLVSDWNHGNAHFLRGIVKDLRRRGHEVLALEPADGWSRTSLVQDQGPAVIDEILAANPGLQSTLYNPEQLDLDELLDGADVVIVHEWNPPELVGRIGRHRARRGRYTLLFHDTHHRSATAPQEMQAYPLDGYDAVLAFGEVIRQRYLHEGWAARAFTWHEAADTTVFRPQPAPEDPEQRRDLVWIGNWGDEERSRELYEHLMEPVGRLGLSATVHGVRYPDDAVAMLRARGLAYEGWLPNHAVPRTFAAHRVTVHVPRRPYARALPGIPTIRVFEALACGIPLVSAPWSDAEGLFRPGQDFLVARDGEHTRRLLRAVLEEPALAHAVASSGLATIRARHTCRHRVDELLAIVGHLGAPMTHSVAVEALA
jgi:spore maturation protein CgeB